MINALLALFFRPERGWDPVPADYAQTYAEAEWQKVDLTLVAKLGQLVGGLEGKEVLDLGGGPGQYSVAFAKSGAIVTWHDVSRNYLRIAQEKAASAGVRITFSLGYMDEAPRVLNKQFDLVFNRICFYYGWNDAHFVGVIYALMRPGGHAFIESNNLSFGWDRLPPFARLRAWINATLGFKIGHPHPPRGRIPALFLKYPIERMTVEFPTAHIDRVFVQKAGRSQ